ncbi:MAG: acetamidase, partial [Aggregatilineales bacterium]
MTIHSIEPTEETLHAYFSNALAPALTIDSGDTVNFKTLDAGGGYKMPDGETDVNSRKKVSFEKRVGDSGHALCGPVYINGA